MRSLKRPVSRFRQGLPADLHPAVDAVDVTEELRLGAGGLHRRAELRLPVVGEDQVLEQHPLLLRDAQRLRDFRRLLGPHHKMAQKLPRHGVVRGQPQLRELELPGLGEVVGEGPGQRAGSGR